MACPFFMPVSRLESGAWLHPSRLPLGAGWCGHCSAPGHEGEEPSHAELTDWCNLGYACACPRLPPQRSCDAVRFSIVQDRGPLITLSFSCESQHRPAGHGTVEYDQVRDTWVRSHPDLRIQKMAECYVTSYLLRRTPPAMAG